MTYETAKSILDKAYETWKPEGEIAEAFETALDALDECLGVTPSIDHYEDEE